MDKNNLILDSDISNMISNKFIAKMAPVDWGKTMAIANEYICRDLMVSLGDIRVAHTDECTEGTEGGLLLEKLNIDISNNGSGFDVIVLANGKRIQCKLRQTNGKTPYSRQVHFENTRRMSGKNLGVAGESGHVRYSSDEFDYVLVSLVQSYKDKSLRKDLNKWNFSFIPIDDLVDADAPGFCVRHIPSSVLEKNKLETSEDWANRFKEAV